MSFFEEGDEPTRRRPRTRARRPAPTARPADQQTLLVRRAVAAGGILLVLILLVVGIKGCLNSQKKSALRDYNHHVTGLVQESDGLGRQLFQQLNSGTARSPLQLEQQINQLRVSSDGLVNQAKSLDVPGEMKTAQRYLLDVLEFRRDGLAKISDKLPTALSRNGADVALRQIAGEMAVFFSSDVTYQVRTYPLMREVLDSNGLAGESVPHSRFLPSIDWLNESTVADKLNVTLTNRRRTGPVAPGLHGHGLDSVSVGSVTLDSTTANHLPAGPPTFTVKFTNAGTNDETDVAVDVTVTVGGKTSKASKTVPSSKAGTQTSVDVPLGTTPTAGQPATIKVRVEPVPGETKTDNNAQTYSAIFGQ